ncbi:MAG: hypothetical protein L0211_20330 [Planctomycetaceae bacterium]|nr:hypothetical protein [Planctomycetaceae bacterium]
MTAEVRCSCGALLRAPAGFQAGRAICPICQNAVVFGGPSPIPKPVNPRDIPMPVVEFLDPPPRPAPPPQVPVTPWPQRMMAALLDPRSIQWMMMIGGGLMVLGLIVWLVSKGIFENTLVVAATLTVGSLLVHAAGCFLALKTRFKMAGQALTFLGCILIPLNLWFYHWHGLMTLEKNLWLGGVVCCAIYVATVLLLRDPLFMYAVEGGITLTVVLLLANQGFVSDAGWLSVVFLGLALVSIHAERAFPPEGEPFDRKRFGLPLFWSGHVQLAAAVLTLAGSQLLALLLEQRTDWLGWQWTWTGNFLTKNVWLAGGVWIAAAYAYFYSDLVVRRIGLYVYLAAACLVAAELTIIGSHLPAEVMIAAPAITALLLTLIAIRPGSEGERLSQNLQPLAMILSGLSVLIGVVLHVRATSQFAQSLNWGYPTAWPFVVTMLLVTACTRAAAVVYQNRSPKTASVYLFLSAASVLVVAAGILRSSGITSWTYQAPILMLVPIAYLIAARLWRGQQPEQPLAIAAHVGTAVILAHLLANTVKDVDKAFIQVEREPLNLWLALAFCLATVFYILATLLRRHGANVYAATACACAAVWQLAGYYDVPHEAYTILYAVLGLAVLAGARLVGIEHVKTFHISGSQSSMLLGRGAAAFHSATALLSLAFLSALLQGLSRLATQRAEWPMLTAVALVAVVSLVAAVMSPTSTWRRVYVSWSIALACVAFLLLNVLIDLTVWRKAEIFCIVLGVVLLVAGYIGRFLEGDRQEGDGVTLALFLGSMLAPAALLIATLYYRFGEGEPSFIDELGLVLVTVLMVITGLVWQLKAPTLIGGTILAAYLLVLVGMLAIHPNVAMGVYLAIGGGLLFGAGIGLSIYRERLLALPDKIKSREGVFQVLNWR